MCITCECGRPLDDHGDSDNLTFDDFQRAAAAARVSVWEVGEIAARALHALHDEPKLAFARAAARPLIVSDIDGILADYVSGACIAVDAAWSKHYTPGTWTTYRGQMTAEERAWLAKLREDSGAFWLSLSACQAAIAALRTLSAQGFQVVIASDRPQRQAAATVTWLEQNEVPYADLVLSGEGGKEALADRCSETARAVFLEDNPARWLTLSRPGVQCWCPRLRYTPPAFTLARIFDSWGDIVRALVAGEGSSLVSTAATPAIPAGARDG